jgi:hypothetical protein
MWKLGKIILIINILQMFLLQNIVYSEISIYKNLAPATTIRDSNISFEKISLRQFITFIKKVEEKVPEHARKLFVSNFIRRKPNFKRALRRYVFMRRRVKLANYIKFQGLGKHHAVSEIVSNSIDAVLEDMGYPVIGRYGMGVFQIFGELKKQGDKIEFNSVRNETRHILILTKTKHDILIDYKEEQAEGEVNGTTVSFKAEIEDKESLREYLKDKYEEENRIPIYITDKSGKIELLNRYESKYREKETKGVRIILTEQGYDVVEDDGHGMDRETIFTKLLVPRRGTKKLDIGEKRLLEDKVLEIRRIEQFEQKEPEKITCKFLLNNVKIEEKEIDLERNNLLKKLVINLPAQMHILEHRKGVNIKDIKSMIIKKINQLAGEALKEDDEEKLKQIIQTINTLCLILRNEYETDKRKLIEFTLKIRNLENIKMLMEELRSRYFILKNRKEYYEKLKIKEKISGREIVYIDEMCLLKIGAEGIIFNKPKKGQVYGVDRYRIYLLDIGKGNYIVDSYAQIVYIDEDTFRETETTRNYTLLKNLIDTYIGYGETPDEDGQAVLKTIEMILEEAFKQEVPSQEETERQREEKERQKRAEKEKEEQEKVRQKRAEKEKEEQERARQKSIREEKEEQERARQKSIRKEKEEQEKARQERAEKEKEEKEKARQESIRKEKEKLEKKEMDKEEKEKLERKLEEKAEKERAKEEAERQKKAEEERAKEEEARQKKVEEERKKEEEVRQKKAEEERAKEEEVRQKKAKEERAKEEEARQKREIEEKEKKEREELELDNKIKELFKDKKEKEDILTWLKKERRKDLYKIFVDYFRSEKSRLCQDLFISIRNLIINEYNLREVLKYPLEESFSIMNIVRIEERFGRLFMFIKKEDENLCLYKIEKGKLDSLGVILDVDFKNVELLGDIDNIYLNAHRGDGSNEIYRIEKSWLKILGNIGKKVKDVSLASNNCFRVERTDGNIGFYRIASDILGEEKASPLEDMAPCKYIGKCSGKFTLPDNFFIEKKSDGSYIVWEKQKKDGNWYQPMCLGRNVKYFKVKDGFSEIESYTLYKITEEGYKEEEGFQHLQDIKSLGNNCWGFVNEENFWNVYEIKEGGLRRLFGVENVLDIKLLGDGCVATQNTDFSWGVWKKDQSGKYEKKLIGMEIREIKSLGNNYWGFVGEKNDWDVCKIEEEKFEFLFNVKKTRDIKLLGEGCVAIQNTNSIWRVLKKDQDGELKEQLKSMNVREIKSLGNNYWGFVDKDNNWKVYKIEEEKFKFLFRTINTKDIKLLGEGYTAIKDTNSTWSVWKKDQFGKWKEQLKSMEVREIKSLGNNYWGFVDEKNDWEVYKIEEEKFEFLVNVKKARDIKLLGEKYLKVERVNTEGVVYDLYEITEEGLEKVVLNILDVLNIKEELSQENIVFINEILKGLEDFPDYEEELKKIKFNLINNLRNFKFSFEKKYLILMMIFNEKILSNFNKTEMDDLSVVLNITAGTEMVDIFKMRGELEKIKILEVKVEKKDIKNYLLIIKKVMEIIGQNSFFQIEVEKLSKEYKEEKGIKIIMDVMSGRIKKEEIPEILKVMYLYITTDLEKIEVRTKEFKGTEDLNESLAKIVALSEDITFIKRLSGEKENKLQQLIETQISRLSCIPSFSQEVIQKEKLVDLLKDKLQTMKIFNQKELQDEWTGIITGQRREFVFINELVQNSRDAILEEKASDRIDIDAYLEKDEEYLSYVIGVKDSVGIEKLSDVVQYLLKCDSSSKGVEISDESLGMFGKGFFTVFEGADEVRIRTGKNGEFYNIVLGVKIENGKYKITVKHIGLEKSEGHGTKIERIVKVRKTDGKGRLAIEMLKFQVYARNYLSGFNPEEIKIYYRDEIINDGHEEVEDVRLKIKGTDIGKVSVLVGKEGKLETLPKITIGGTFYKLLERDDEYLRYVPKIYREHLFTLGSFQIRLPKQVRLVSSRADMLEEQREAVTMAIAAAVLKTIVTMYLKKQEKRFPGVPEDFWYGISKKRKAAETSFIENINQGNYENIDELLTLDEQELTAFMVTLEVKGKGEEGKNRSMVGMLKEMKVAVELQRKLAEKEVELEEKLQKQKAGQERLAELQRRLAEAEKEKLAKQIAEQKAKCEENIHTREGAEIYNPKDGKFKQEKTVTTEMFDKGIEYRIIIKMLNEIFDLLRKHKQKKYHQIRFGYYEQKEKSRYFGYYFKGYENNQFLEVKKGGGYKPIEVQQLDIMGITPETEWIMLLRVDEKEVLKEVPVWVQDALKNLIGLYKEGNFIAEDKEAMRCFNIFLYGVLNHYIHEYSYTLEKKITFSHTKEGKKSFMEIMKGIYKDLIEAGGIEGTVKILKKEMDRAFFEEETASAA